MFTVTGVLNGVPYVVTRQDNGRITGSEAVEHLLLKHEGEMFRASPTHGALALDPLDPPSVLLALRNLTVVSAIEGDSPDLPDDDEDDDPGTDH